jgi:hypothetical protein
MRWGNDYFPFVIGLFPFVICKRQPPLKMAYEKSAMTNGK